MPNAQIECSRALNIGSKPKMQNLVNEYKAVLSEKTGQTWAHYKKFLPALQFPISLPKA